MRKVRFTDCSSAWHRVTVNAGFQDEAMQVQQDFPPLLRGVLQGLRILLVEDAPDSSYLLTRFLGVAGAIVETAEDGAEAVSKANHLLHDVIFMDIQMPIMDGFTATRILR